MYILFQKHARDWLFSCQSEAVMERTSLFALPEGLLVAFEY